MLVLNKVGINLSCHRTHRFMVSSSNIIQLLSLMVFAFTANLTFANQPIDLAAPGFDLNQLQDAAVCDGEDVLITTVSTDANALSYDWEIDMGTGFVSTGVTSSDYSINDAQCILSGAMVRVKVNYLDPADGDCEVISAPVTIYVNCESTLACYQSINMSIDANCEALVHPRQFISNYLSEDFYTLSFTDDAGNNFTTDDLGDYIGETLTYHIVDRCGQSGWGMINIEDKTGAQLSNCIDYVMTCEEYEAGNSQDLYKPNFNANCIVEDAIFVFEDDTLNVMCENGYGNAILRTWLAFDADSNYLTQCEQRINIAILDISEVVFPSDTIIDYTQSMSCDVFSDEALHPDNIGYPEGVTCPNFNWYYEDIEFDICGAGRKLLRKWTVINWCSGETVKGEHIIKILDDEPPIKVCPPDTIKFQALYGCVAEVNLDPFDLDHGIGAIQSLVDCSLPVKIYVEFLPAEPGTDQPAADGTYSSTGVVKETNGTYTLPMIPSGLVWVRYRFEDACGNGSPLTSTGTDDSGSCYFEVQVIDGEDPTAICKGSLMVTLDDYGYATVEAEEIDNYSNDICGDIVKYEIRRQGYCTGHQDDLNFGPSVHFCCSDVGENIWVFLQVTDSSGNTAICETQIQVKEGSGGGGSTSITCPDDITLECEDDHLSYPYPTVTVGYHDGCDDPGTYYSNVTYDYSNLDGCGTGYIVRTVTITFTSGATQSCSHNIYIEAGDPLDPDDISVAEMLTVSNCDPYADSLSPDVIGGEPVISNGSTCISVTEEYDDEVIPGDYGDECQHIKRTWTITDWCVDSPSLGYGIYVYVQTIKLTDNIKPSIDNCEDMWLNVASEHCDMEVNFNIEAHDNCTPSELLDIHWSIEVNKDGNASNDIEGTGASVSAVLPIGQHEVHVIVKDACGNKRTCTYDIFVEGDASGGVTPVCLSQLSWTISPGGEAEIWASDFDFDSSGGCVDGTGSLTFSFTDPAFEITPAITFDCSDLTNGIAASVPIQIWVIDGTGQSDWCFATLNLVDILDVCPDYGLTNSTISGRLTSEEGQPVSEIEVMLEDMTNDQMNSDMSDNDGNYAFQTVDFFNDYLVKPENDKNHILGVSTIDIVKIQRHILDIEKLDSPFKLIAADVNNSKGVTSIDLLQIRKLILGVYDKFPENKSWVFVAKDYVFPDEENPWDYNEEAYIQNLSILENEFDFTAIKVGDVNGNAIEGFASDDTSDRSLGLILKVDNQDFDAESDIVIPVYSNNFDEVVGMQFTIESSKLDFTHIVANKLPIKEANYKIEGSRMSFSWNDLSPISMDSEPLFFIHAKSQWNGSLKNELFMTNSITPSESVVGKTLEQQTIQLEVGGQDKFEYALGQNRPNPFSTESNIRFVLEEDQHASLSFFDPQGRELKRIQGLFKKGENIIEISSDWFGTTGIVYYKLEADKYSAIRKMVIVN